MPKQTNIPLKTEAIRLREEERLTLGEIAARIGTSVGSCFRWLKDHPLTPEETRQRHANAARQTMTGRKQSLETIRKRVEKSREKQRARAIERFGGAWIAAKESGQIKYVSNKPCEKGHVERYAKSRACVECEFEKQRDPSRRLLKLCTAVRYRAKKEGLPFNLTQGYLHEIWPADDCCPILHQPFEYATGERQKGATRLSPSIDKRLPELGYVKGNVAIISNYINTLKNNCTNPAVFRRIADWIEGA